MLCDQGRLLKLKPEPLKGESRQLTGEDWRAPLRGEAGGRRRGNYRVLTVVVLATFVVPYVDFPLTERKVL